MFRFLTIFLTIGAIASLSACGRSDEPSGSITNNAQSNDGFANRNVEQPKPKTPSVSNDFSSLPAPYDKADYNLGRRTFKLCGACHTVRENTQHLVGPNLHGIFQRQVGSLENFKYSDALSGAKFRWTPERVDEWLANPKEFLPGNNMSFAGVRKPGDRKAVVAYLMFESGYNEDTTAE